MTHDAGDDGASAASSRADAVIVVNPRSGRTDGGADPLAARLAAKLGTIGLDARIIAFDPAGADPDGWQRELREALAAGAARVYVLGGDGTVLAVATQLLGQDVPLGIVPLGTANLLARDLGLPLDPAQAAAALVPGRSRRIDAGRVNGHLFLCASMLGMTTGLAEAREGARGVGSWRLLPAMLRKAYWLLKRYPFRSVTLGFDDGQLAVSTRAMLVSNNPLRRGGGLYPGRERLDAGLLGIYGVREGPLYELPRLALALVTGSWPSEPRIFHRGAKRMTIETRKPHATRVLNDGEPLSLRTPLRYDILTAALTVLVPKEGAE